MNGVLIVVIYVVFAVAALLTLWRIIVGPSILDQLVTSTPALQVMPATADNSDSPRDRFGMVCENLTARCR